MQLDNQSLGTHKHALKQATPCTVPVLIMILWVICVLAC